MGTFWAVLQIEFDTEIVQKMQQKTNQKWVKRNYNRLKTKIVTLFLKFFSRKSTNFLKAFQKVS